MGLPIPPLTADVVVPLDAEAAFDLFTAGFATWWPPEFSWSGAAHLQDIGIEPEVDGFLYERGPHGFRLDWGRVLVWDRPDVLAFTWQIGPDRLPVPDPAAASEVEVTFTAAEPGSTRITVTHGRWERHGPGGATYRENFAEAWPYALARLAEVAATAAV